MQPLVIKDYRQIATTVPTPGGFRKVVRVSYNVYNGDTLVGSHSVDYPESSATTQQITGDMQTYQRDLQMRLEAAAKGVA